LRVEQVGPRVSRGKSLHFCRIKTVGGVCPESWPASTASGALLRRRRSRNWASSALGSGKSWDKKTKPVKVAVTLKLRVGQVGFTVGRGKSLHFSRIQVLAAPTANSGPVGRHRGRYCAIDDPETVPEPIRVWENCGTKTRNPSRWP
jgi:hypothetical protein